MRYHHFCGTATAPTLYCTTTFNMHNYCLFLSAPLLRTRMATEVRGVKIRSRIVGKQTHCSHQKFVLKVVEFGKGKGRGIFFFANYVSDDQTVEKEGGG